MRGFVEQHVEVFALSVGAHDAAAGDMLLEGFGAAADFAVDDVVGVRDAGGDCAADEVFADEVDYAGYFADLGRVSVRMEWEEGSGDTSGMLAAGL